MRINIRCVIRLRLWGRVRIRGRDNIPATGAVLVASNHLGGGDPPLLWVTFPRPLYFMAMSGLFRIPVVGYLVRATGAFPVRRNSPDRGALQHALALLRSGESVAIYPEGERSMEADLVRPNAGVGFLALLASVPILPVGMAGTERILPRVPMRAKQRGIDMNIGEPFVLPPGMRDRTEAAEYIMARIAPLIPEQYRGYRRAPA